MVLACLNLTLVVVVQRMCQAETAARLVSNFDRWRHHRVLSRRRFFPLQSIRAQSHATLPWALGRLYMNLSVIRDAFLRRQSKRLSQAKESWRAQQTAGG